MPIGLFKGPVLRTECIIYVGQIVALCVAPSGGVALITRQRHLCELVDFVYSP